jgi:hypothetical protein
MPALASKLGPDSFLVVLEKLAASRKGLYAYCLPTLLFAPAAQQVSPGSASRFLHMLADKGHAVSPVLELYVYSNQIWMSALTQAQVLNLMQLAVQHGNYQDLAHLHVFPAAQDLGPDSILQLALQLMHAWDISNKHSWQWASYIRALEWILQLPGAMALSLQQCNQLADVAMHKGRGLQMLVWLYAQSISLNHFLGSTLQCGARQCSTCANRVPF